MAIYHLSASIVSRQTGRSSTASAAYRSASRIVDERTGLVFDFRRKRGVRFAEIILPEGTPAWNRSTLWNAVEAKNKRADSQVAREITVAIPAELPHVAQGNLVREFSQWLADQYGVGIDLAVHEPGSKGDNRNVHAHLLVTTNAIGPGGLGNKVRRLDFIAGVMAGNGSSEITTIRQQWEHLVNEALANAGSTAQVDCRSLAAQGIDREPGRHQGPAATGMGRRGATPNRSPQPHQQREEIHVRGRRNNLVQIHQRPGSKPQHEPQPKFRRHR